LSADKKHLSVVCARLDFYFGTKVCFFITQMFSDKNQSSAPGFNFKVIFSFELTSLDDTGDNKTNQSIENDEGQLPFGQQLEVIFMVYSFKDIVDKVSQPEDGPGEAVQEEEKDGRATFPLESKAKKCYGDWLMVELVYTGHSGSSFKVQAKISKVKYIFQHQN
jgi:hypothetical protein